jgi:DNA-binding NarL/FixJ family response regulator
VAEVRTDEAIRCLVADDHPAVLKAVTDYLTAEGVTVVAQARNGTEALAKLSTTEPQVAVVDLRMPDMTGTDVAREAAKVAPDVGVILYTGQADQSQLVDAVDAGARGFVLKEAPLSDLTRAVETVAAGGTYVDAVLAGTLASARAMGQLVELTARERDVLRLLADGCSYDEIGQQLFISSETVRTHVQKAMRRLDASNRTQAVAMALRQSLIA